MANTITNEQVISALLGNKTITAAADQLGVVPNTIYKRLHDQEFMDQYDAAKAQLLEDCSTNLKKSLQRAAETVQSIMENEDNSPQIRLNAAQILLQMAVKYDAVQRDNYKQDNPLAALLKF